jgi:cobyrinic acid a,c-diamide synthase
MAAWRARGHTVAAAKVGPDFIDPGYHAVATGRPGRNLDAWICGSNRMAALAARASRGAEMLVIEGVMGLFDGASEPVTGEPDDFASTAHIARLLGAPVVLVVDASAVSRSVAATVHGFATFDPGVRIAGVVLNRVGSDGHETLLREALAPLRIPVVGALRRDDSFMWRDRHLGLVPVAEHAAAVGHSIERLARGIERDCDLGALHHIACTAPAVDVPFDDDEHPSPGRARIAVAAGPAFSFVYADNLEAFGRMGAEVVPFDPCRDPVLPDGVGALYAGGGFPEVYAKELAANRPLLDDVRRRVDRGLVVLAECGGLLWLARSLDGNAMAGVIPADARMTDELTLGYRTARVMISSAIAPAGDELRGHEFHYSVLEPPGDALMLRGRFGRGSGGYAVPSVLASYLHLHFGGDDRPARRLVARATAP